MQNISKRLPHWLPSVLLVGVLRVFYYLRMLPYTYMTDTFSYMEHTFRFTPPFHLEVVNGRVPLYSRFISLCVRLIGHGGEGTYKYIFLVSIQCLVSLFCLVLFYKACALLVKNRWVCSGAVVLFGLCPAVIGWDTVLLTESLALSGTAAFLYFVIRYLKEPCFWAGAGAVGLMFVLTFLRPTFLLFDGLLLGLWVLRMFALPAERPLLKKLIACSLAVFAFVLLYSGVMYRSNGLFNISDPLPRQLAKVCVDRGYYKNSPNPDFVATVEQGIAESTDGSWPVVATIFQHYSMAETQQLSKQAILHSLPDYIRDTLQIYGEVGRTRFDGYAELRPDDEVSTPVLVVGDAVRRLFSLVTGNLIYLATAVHLVLFVTLWVRRRQVPWVHLGLFTFLLLIPFTSVVATCDEYVRTMICVVPFFYVSLAMLAGWLTERVSRSIRARKEALLPCS